MPTLSIKVGGLEVTYEGDQPYIEGGLLALIKELANLPPIAPTSPAVGGSEKPGEAAIDSSNGGGPIGHTTSQIAHAMSANTGTDLALAAAVHLTFAKKQEQIRRADILSEMKGAGGYYKETFGKNLTFSIDSLIKSKRLNPISTGVYSLPTSIRKQMADKLKGE